MQMKKLGIDFLYLDLNACERCKAADSSLNEALAALSGVFDALGYAANVNKVNITTKELAEEYRFYSSPTIRVNGIDVCGEIKENNCKDCGDLCGDDTDCRVFVYNGREYEHPPAAMIIDGILQAMYGNLSPDEETYVLPENLEKFFTGKKSGCCSQECNCAFQFREMAKDDWESVSHIYQQGMDTNLATFETECPSYEVFDASHTADCRYVITDDEAVIGWAALSPVSNRCIYGGVAEVSVYIDEKYKGKGAGTQLLTYVIEKSELHGFWTLQSGIMQDNPASIRLHEKCGFRMVGFREKIGKERYGQWRNTVLMEKRSQHSKFNLRRDITMKKMSIYEPAMCCETGICGVGVDPELLRISTVLNALKKNGVEVKRYNLNSAPKEFVSNTTINQFVNEKGVEGLPAVMLDGEIIITGRYPANEEFISLLGIPESYLSEPKSAKNKCCCSDGKCC